jgi:hypothetical protein
MPGRAGADSLCAQAQAAHAALSGLQTHAFLCIEAADAVVDMPANYGVPPNVPVVSLNGTQLAASFGAFVGSGLEVTLEQAGVFPSSASFQQFFVGCGAGGTIAGCIHRCNGFANNSAGLNGCVGHSDYTTADWLAWGNILSCDAERAFLCLAY